VLLISAGLSLPTVRGGHQTLPFSIPVRQKPKTMHMGHTRPQLTVAVAVLQADNLETTGILITALSPSDSRSLSSRRVLRA
jgi:hypothetical protein